MPAAKNQRLVFRDRFRSLYREDFQTWFEELARVLHPVGDYQAIRRTQGDGGLDGIVISSQLVYAVYAPARRDEDRDSETAAKIRSDFATACSRLQGRLKAWAFVHNHPEAKLGQLGAKAINELKSKNPSVEITVLNIDSLWEKLAGLSDETLKRLFGEGKPAQEGRHYEADEIRRGMENYRSFVKRCWLSRWSDTIKPVVDSDQPPFIQEQTIRILSLEGSTMQPRSYLRVEHFRALRVREEATRRRKLRDNLGMASHALKTEPLRELRWVPISRSEVVDHLISPRASKLLHRTVLVTDAGVGKTTNIQWLHYALNSTGSKLALLINAADLPPSVNELSETLVAVLRRAQGNDIRTLSIESGHRMLHDLQSTGRLVLLIDALDQIQLLERSCLRTLSWILNDENWQNCAIVLGSRPFAIERDWGLLFTDERATGWQFLHVDEFTEAQQRAYLGDKRYRQVPEDAYEVLSIPRVLSYLRLSSDQEIASIRTASDVYCFITRKLFAEGLRATEATRLIPNQARLVLAAIAFEMVSRGNFAEVRPSQVDEFVRAVSGHCTRHDPSYTLHWTWECLKGIASMNEFISHGILEAGCPQQIRWRNRSLQEFFAALWLTKYASEEDTAALAHWVYLPDVPTSGDYSWVWRFATEMPDDVRHPVVWTRAMTPLYVSGEGLVSGVKRSTEMLYRSWHGMKRYAQASGSESYSAVSLATTALDMFESEFKALKGGRCRRTKRIARQLLEEFREIPKPLSNSEPLDSTADGDSQEDDDGSTRTQSVIPFQMTCYLVTQEQYSLFDRRVVPPCFLVRERRRWPITHVSWYDAWAFCQWLGGGCRLPEEDEWEFACRAGTSTAYHFGERPSRAYMRSGRFHGVRRLLIPVGCLRPNSWGLYDMHGLAWEWCDTLYSKGRSDRRGDNMELSRSTRIIKGGAANTSSRRATVSDRDFRDPGDQTGMVSFRIVRPSNSEPTALSRPTNSLGRPVTGKPR